jgi:hypothetical protein
MTCISPSPPPPPACTIHLMQGYIQVICTTPYDLCEEATQSPGPLGVLVLGHARHVPASPHG